MIKEQAKMMETDLEEKREEEKQTLQTAFCSMETLSEVQLEIHHFK